MSDLIADFAAVSGNGAFPGINRADVATGLRDRIANPKRIDTSNINLCGPAAFFYCLLNDNPDLYTRYVIEMYNTGTSQLGTLTVSPGSDCRNHRPNPSNVAAVDWVALASLRDSENSVLDFDDDDTGAGGVTMPHSMVDWFTACGYQQIADTTSVWVLSSPSDFGTMGRFYLQGRWVCLFINDNLLYASSETDWSVIPNHWVVLTSAVPVADGQTSFSVFSWGRDYMIRKAATDELRRNLYGFVAATKPRVGDFPRGGGGVAAG